MKQFSIFLSVFFLLTSLFTSMARALPDEGNGEKIISFQNETLQARLFWQRGPQLKKESVLYVQFIDPARRETVEISEQLSLVLWMANHGHGSAPTSVQRVLDNRDNVVRGLYKISNIYFMMAGTWELRFTLKNSNGTEETVTTSELIQAP